MIHKESMSVHQGMMRRPRINALIQDGMQYPFLVMLAGPGYGKTQAMAGYLEKSDANVTWIRLSSLDNLSDHFWDHLIRALKPDHLEAFKKLNKLGFPDTAPKFDTFLQILSNLIGEKKQTVWVFDDYGQVEDHRVKDFIQMLVEAQLENFHLVLMSNMLNSTESIAFMTGRRFLILTDDLRFTRKEIEALYKMHGISLEQGELSKIERYTEGWPLSLNLLVQHNKKIPDTHYVDEKAVSHMFEEHFLHYDEDQQVMLVKLSVLNFFGKELIKDLYKGSSKDLAFLDNHAFVTAEPTTGRLYFHNQYRMFLRNKRHLLDAQEECKIWRKAGNYYMSSGDTMEAITCYYKSGDHNEMLNAIRAAVLEQYDISEKTANFFLKHIDLLPPEEQETNPLVDSLRAMIYMDIVQLEKAEELLLKVEEKMLHAGTKESEVFLGEAYVVQGFTHMMGNQEDFGDYFKKAVPYLPEGTNFKNKDGLRVYDNHNFSMQDNLPGAKERMERAVHNGMYWLNQIDGDMQGMEHIFSSEASYLSYQLKEAQQHAYRGIYKAEASAQHDLVLNGYCLLARIGLMQGDYAEMSKHIQGIVEYAARYEIGALNEIRDTALGWYYIKLKDYKKIPKSIATMDHSSKSMLLYGRAQIVYANYLINTEEYAKLVGMLEYSQGMHLSKGIWPDRICRFIMLAIGYHHLGNSDAAMKALWMAYDMTHANGLITLFIEADRHMCALIDTAKQQNVYKFEPEWLDLISKRASSFSKRASAVRTAYQRQNPVAAIENSPLSKREGEVLQALSQGLTREEIAADQYISVNTVKSIIRSIYNKLDANNRAEAVSIAIAHGYIEGHMC